jgi:uncharacterized protein YneF (UPF0154 family)
MLVPLSLVILALFVGVASGIYLRYKYGEK